MSSIFSKVENASDLVRNNRKSTDVFLQVVEEVGELSKELRTKYDTTSYKTEGEDGILGESCDILIALLDLIVLEGYTEEDVKDIIDKKLNKWLDKLEIDTSL